MGSPWEEPFNQELSAWKTMQLAIVMTEKGGVISCELCGDLHLVEGGGVKHRWGQDSHLHQRLV